MSSITRAVAGAKGSTPKQPVVKVPASTETDEAPRWQGATTENIGPYLKKEQRRQRGCIAGRMPAGLSAHTTGC